MHSVFKPQVSFKGDCRVRRSKSLYQFNLLYSLTGSLPSKRVQ